MLPHMFPTLFSTRVFLGSLAFIYVGEPVAHLVYNYCQSTIPLCCRVPLTTNPEHSVQTDCQLTLGRNDPVLGISTETLPVRGTTPKTLSFPNSTTSSLAAHLFHLSRLATLSPQHVKHFVSVRWQAPQLKSNSVPLNPSRSCCAVPSSLGPSRIFTRLFNIDKETPARRVFLDHVQHTDSSGFKPEPLSSTTVIWSPAHVDVARPQLQLFPPCALP